MKYMLIEVCERDIGTPELFDSHDDAHGEMCQRVAEVLGVNTSEIMESYLSGEEYNEHTCVTESTAWTERYGNNFDWKIFKYEEESQCVS